MAGSSRRPSKVTYSDGTSSTFTQSLSDWTLPQSFSGESNALIISYRDVSDGDAERADGVCVRVRYSFSPNSAKTVSSVTLPSNGNVEVLGLTVAP